MYRGSCVIFIFLTCAALVVLPEAAAKINPDVIQMEQNPPEAPASLETYCLSNSLTYLNELEFENYDLSDIEPQIIDNIDYSNLSISDALMRLIEISPDLTIAKLQMQQAEHHIKQVKADTWLPEINMTLKAFAPVNFISDKNEENGMFTGEECKIIFRLNSDSLDKIGLQQAKQQTSLSEFKQTLTEEARYLIETYLQLALAQKSMEITQKSLEDSKILLQEIKNDEHYSDLEVAQAEHFVARIFEKKLTSYNRLKTAQRNLRSILGLETRPDIKIKVSDSFSSLKDAESFVALENLAYEDNSLLVMENKLKEAQLAQKINYEPLVEMALSVTANASQGTEDTKATTSAISSLQFNFFITDFGYSNNYNKAIAGLRQLAELEVKQKQTELALNNANTKNEIDNLMKRVGDINTFINETEDAIELFKNQVKMPINVLFKRNDQLVEARYLLKEMIRDYAFDLSLLDKKYIQPYKTNPEYESLDFIQLYKIAQNNKTIEEEIIDKKIEIETYELNMAKCNTRPKMRAGFSFGNESYTDGDEKNTTIAYASLNGKILNERFNCSIKRAEARLNNALAQKNLIYNEKYSEIINSYILALQIQRRIKLIGEIVDLKDMVIKEYQEGIDSGLPKYEDVDLKPLIMEQLESNLALTKWELELATEKNNLKRYCGIPINENISLKDTGIFNWHDEEIRNNFIKTVDKNIKPYYDAQAPIKSATFRVEEYLARQQEATAFRGLSWRLLAQGRGDETKGWTDPNKQISLSFSLPFWGHNKQQINKISEQNDRLRSELQVIKAKKDLEKLINQIKSRFDAATIMLKNLSGELDNLTKQYDIIEQYHKMGIKSKRDLLDAKMRVLAVQLDYEDKMQSYLNSESQLLLVLGNIKERSNKKKTIKLESLSEAIDIALKNSLELKVYENLCESEESALKYFRPVYIDGNLSTDIIREDNKDAENERDVLSFVALAGLDIDLANQYLLRQQKAKTELCKLDLKRNKFEITLSVVDAYCNYMESLATLKTVDARLKEEENKLQSMAPGTQVKTTTEMDYLRQLQVFNMVRQKYTAVNEDCDNYKKRLVLLLFGPDNQYSNVELANKFNDYNSEVLADAIRSNLLDELKSIYAQIFEPLNRENVSYASLEALEAKSSTQATAKKIKSIIIEIGYAHLNDELGELALFEEERLSLPLLRDDDLGALHEFVTLNISAKIYDPNTLHKTKIKELDEEIASQMAKRNLRKALDEAQRIFDEYEIALIDYQYASNKIYKIEQKMRERMKELKKIGKLSVIEEMEIIGMLIKNRTDREKALYRILSLRNQLNEYLKKYTNKDLNELATFSYTKNRKDALVKVKSLGIRPGKHFD